MEPYIIIPLLVILIGVLWLMAKVRRLERENRALHVKYAILSEIGRNIFAVSEHLVRLHDDLDRHNRCEPNDKSTSTPESNHDED